jgi:hypothetical protein
MKSYHVFWDKLNIKYKKKKKIYIYIYSLSEFCDEDFCCLLLQYNEHQNHISYNFFFFFEKTYIL